MFWSVGWLSYVEVGGFFGVVWREADIENDCCFTNVGDIGFEITT